MKLKYLIAVVFPLALFSAYGSNANLSDQLVYHETFDDLTRAHWLGDGVLLGRLLKRHYGTSEGNLPTVLYPAENDTAPLAQAPFRYINFADKPYYYYYPGRFVSSEYDHRLNEQEYEMLKQFEQVRVTGRYQTFFLVIPPPEGLPSPIRLYRFSSASFAIPTSLFE